jgi:tetratricopeptide (TPR) repeat protein
VHVVAIILAVALINGCATLSGVSARGSFERGVSLFNQGEFEAAIPHFKAATDRDPSFAPAYFYLGRSYVSLSRWRAAIPPLRAAVRLAPEAAKGEIMTVLTDAMFALAVNDWRFGERNFPLPEPPRRIPEYPL